jgi:thiamine pyrophosphate-dependent acetolactate synthase large subunit-like protein
VDAARVESRDELHAELADALGAGEPRVVEVKVAPGMSL